MSHVFKALQRANAENSGTEEEMALTATELLERVERQALSEWRPGDGAKELRDVREGNAISSPMQSESLGETSSGETFDSVDLAANATREDVFREFKSVGVSPPPGSRLVSVVDRGSPAAEAFRLLAVRLRDFRKKKPLKKVLITSTIPQEGKSFASANLACTLAMNPQQKTLLIEGDVRQPSLGALLGVEQMPGICEYLRGERSLSASIYHLDIPEIWFLPAGDPLGDPLRIFQSTKLPSLMDQLVRWFDWIIIDSPPVLPLADTTAWARLSEGVLLVTRRGTTKSRKLKKGLEALANNRLIGALLNSSDGTADNDYYYYRHNPRGARQSDNYE